MLSTRFDTELPPFEGTDDTLGAMGVCEAALLPETELVTPAAPAAKVGASSRAGRLHAPWTLRFRPSDSRPFFTSALAPPLRP